MKNEAVRQTTKLEAIHKHAMERYESIPQFERNNRSVSVEDLKFAHADDGQWDENAIKKRKNKPRFTINKIAAALDQCIGDQRQNRIQIKVRPVSGGADEDRAKILSGLIKNIESVSRAESAYDAAFDEALAGGYGGFRIITEISDEDVFSNNQDIKIKPICGATTSLWIDPSAKEYDRRDSNWMFLETEMQMSEYKDKFPDSIVAEWGQEDLSRNVSDWLSGETVRVAEYWVKTPIEKHLCLLSDGRVIDKNDEKNVLDEIAAMGITVVKERTVDSFKVESYLINGSEVLKGPMPWAGKYIPLIPVYGKVNYIDGNTYVRGMVRTAKDPSRIYNYATSAAIETTALTPKDPIWITAAQAKGREPQLATFNERNSPFMVYNSDPSAPGAPKRTGAPSVQTALLAQVQQAGLDIHSTTGMEPPSLGNSPELKSGKAIIAQQKMGDRGKFIYDDNLTKSVEFAGEILIDLIPKIYDTARIVRVMNLDGTSDTVDINQEALDAFNQPIIDEQTGKQVIVNDLTAGKYDVVASTGPAHATQRETSAQQLIDLASGNEVFGRIATDLIAKNLDVLEGEELTSRIRSLMIKDGIVKPTEEEIKELGLDKPQPPNPEQAALVDNVNMQTQKLISDIEKQDAETQKTLIQAQTETIKGYETMVKAMKEQQEAGLTLTKDEGQMLRDQQAIVELAQDATVVAPNLPVQ